MKALLSFEQAPPFDVPVRFMLTAVPFGIAAGLLLMLSGDALASRWSPQCLALTHLMTVGLMLHAMTGALLQITPVAIGANLPSPRRLAAVVHPCMTAGAASLVAAFLGAGDSFYLVGAAGLSVAVGVLAVTALVALLRAPVRNPSRHAMQLALAGLLLTALFGVALALARAGQTVPEGLVSTPTHWRLGWFAWGLALLSGASYLVVPMFQLTPQYPASFQRAFVPALAVAGILILLAPTGIATQLLLGALAASYALTTLVLQHRRRRPRVDTSYRFWQLSLASVLCATAVAIAMPMLPEPDRAEVLLGLLVMLGAFDSVICGMMYKIIPFLAWLHLNNNGSRPLLMHQVIEEHRMKIHFRLHAAAVVLTLGAPWLPALAIPAGALLVAAHTVQGANIAQGLLRYHERKTEMAISV